MVYCNGLFICWFMPSASGFEFRCGIVHNWGPSYKCCLYNVGNSCNIIFSLSPLKKFKFIHRYKQIKSTHYSILSFFLNFNFTTFCLSLGLRALLLAASACFCIFNAMVFVAQLLFILLCVCTLPFKVGIHNEVLVKKVSASKLCICFRKFKH